MTDAVPAPRAALRSRWRCLICGARGIGDVSIFNAHYDDNHYSREGDGGQ